MSVVAFPELNYVANNLACTITNKTNVVILKYEHGFIINLQFAYFILTI